MRALLRRVLNASVSVDSKVVGSIEEGLLIYLGIGGDDHEEDADWIVKKALGIRVFDDDKGRMNLPISDQEGILLISQFTLFGNVRKGNRPSFNDAAKGEFAKGMFNFVCARVQELFPGQLQVGVFGADMKVISKDDGPVTVWLDSRNKSY